MANTTIWIGKEDTVSWREVGGNVRLELGSAVVWITPEQWAELTAGNVTRLPVLKPVSQVVRMPDPAVFADLGGGGEAA